MEFLGVVVGNNKGYYLQVLFPIVAQHGSVGVVVHLDQGSLCVLGQITVSETHQDLPQSVFVEVVNVVQTSLGAQALSHFFQALAGISRFKFGRVVLHGFVRQAQYKSQRVLVGHGFAAAQLHDLGQILFDFFQHGFVLRTVLFFEGVGFDAPYKTVADWYDYQCAYVGARENIPASDTPLYTDTVSFSEVIVFERKNLIAKKLTASLYHDRILLQGEGREDTVFTFEEVSAITALGRTKINIYRDKEVYQLAGGDRFCGLKYVNLHYRYKNMDKESYDGKFLGL